MSEQLPILQDHSDDAVIEAEAVVRSKPNLVFLDEIDEHSLKAEHHIKDAMVYFGRVKIADSADGIMSFRPNRNR